MRLWNFMMIPYLPDNQLRGQWRECALIAHELKEHGTPNHLLVNKVTEYSVDHFYSYCVAVWSEMQNRGFTTTAQSMERVGALGGKIVATNTLFDGWHDKNYLRICYSNLAEKHFYGIGKSRITDEEWQRLVDGYRQITGEEYRI